MLTCLVTDQAQGLLSKKFTLANSVLIHASPVLSNTSSRLAAGGQQ
jgi:hypothetical protein